ncbi:MAG TPA: glycogen debranching protein GlgX, partial [Saprospiraceae bacterium]|nr:glycogen debranching protein GlgX [Saprospiraceae bacterium]
MKNNIIETGQSFPIGPTVFNNGVNFSLFSKNASSVELLLFDNVNDVKPARVITLDAKKNRTYHYWHVFVSGIGHGQLYGYRVTGPFEPAQGHRFDPAKLLLDPYSKLIAVPDGYDREACSGLGATDTPAMKSVVADLSLYDWEGDKHPQHTFAKTIIYEMHVGGFTKNPNSGVAEGKRGTYAGLIEKIPYLVELGITAVELLPVFQFDEQDCPKGHKNYWGYCPVSFFAPHQAYSSGAHPAAALNEFRDMVKALHRAGIEVILDVVFNHTAEGNQDGPTFSYRGIDNSIYYILEKDKSFYANYSGTGNTLNANNPIVRRMILDSLRFWVSEMHVDGFRFDLASILARDGSGNPIENPPVLWDIESDPVLAGVKLIAEAWDAAGLYQVGSFIGDSWKEWNGQFRDHVRSFAKGDPGTLSKFVSKLLGSPDLYGHQEREPEQSINFVTCHDGFTLNDLVSYNSKHNEANLEDNRDGSNDNLSWNFGVEGATDDPAIAELRNRQVKNLFTYVLMAIGAPMLLMGDEVRRTQSGNNNAYCQDNEISWFDWDDVQRHPDILRFVKMLIRTRLQRDSVKDEYSMSLNQLLRQPLITWHGTKANRPDWSDDSHSIACTIRSLSGAVALHCIFNAYSGPLEFDIPAMNGANWKRWIDTALPSPDDICTWADATDYTGNTYRVQAYSVVIFFCAA